MSIDHSILSNITSRVTKYEATEPLEPLMLIRKSREVIDVCWRRAGIGQRMVERIRLSHATDNEGLANDDMACVRIAGVWYRLQQPSRIIGRIVGILRVASLNIDPVQGANGSGLDHAPQVPEQSRIEAVRENPA